MKSRKNTSATGSLAATSHHHHPKTFSSSTTAAAVSVTRFGQTTFTSVRRQDHSGENNGNFIPLKKSQLDTDVEQQTHNNRKIEAKPKVYKFFKSRATAETKSDSSNQDCRANCNPPKPLLLNNFSKQDGIRRITTNQPTYGRIKADPKNSNQPPSTLISKSVNLTERKSCEIKICGDKTIKTIISPTKKTEFIIRNNSSNVRNATVKPNVTPVQILPANRGIRSSRRLRGVEPESVQEPSSAIHLVFEKKPTNSNLTTTIDIVPEKSSDPCENQVKVSDDDHEIKEKAVVNEQPETQEISLDENGKETDSQICNDEENLIKTESQSTMDAIIEESSNLTLNNQENVESLEKNSQETCVDLPPDENESSQTSSIDQMEEKNSQQNDSSNGQVDEMKIDPTNQPSGNEANKIESKAKPKKKIFSNRDRSKVEFNTRSIFTSDLKDEFDMELDSKNAIVGNVEKKSVENDDDETYIKLKRIKKAHQCHELGEAEQFDEDIKYYLSGIVSSNPNSMRCLSILGLTQQAMRPEFRMHLRAHDDMPRIIKALMDAPQDSNLALCTACLMFIYNQDRLTMDIDPNALSLMLELLETRSDECNQVEEKHRAKVKSLVEEMKNKGHAQYLKLNEITAGKLAMETLLGLTSKRAGDWFKVELRKMKGIDFIVDTVIRCAEHHAEEGQMVKIDRCMHVLENVTFNNVENQLYITNYNESKFISTCISLLIECKNKIISSNDSKIFLSAFFSILRVLTNLTSESAEGCRIVGKFDGVIELLLESLFELPSFIMSDQRFDLMVIILCLCINLAEFCEHIRDIIMNSSKYMSKLCELLFKKIEEAAQVEQQTDHLLESHETVQMTEAMQDNLLMQMISKSGTHMEHSLLSACVCLLFGCCIQDSDQYKDLLKEALPDHSFKPLVEQLEKLRDFAHLADIMTQKGKDRVQKVLQIFKSYN